MNAFFDKFIFTNSLKYRNNNFFLVNIPFVICPTELLKSLVARNDEELNKDIYYSVKESTRSELLKQFDVDFGLHHGKAIKLVEDFFSASGWGLITNVDVDPENRRAIVVVDNSPFAESLRGHAHMEVNHFMRGVLAGLFSHAFGVDLDCVESECSALRGVSCKFIVQGLEHFDFSKPEFRRQLRVTA